MVLITQGYLFPLARLYAQNCHTEYQQACDRSLQKQVTNFTALIKFFGKTHDLLYRNHLHPLLESSMETQAKYNELATFNTISKANMEAEKHSIRVPETQTHDQVACRRSLRFDDGDDDPDGADIDTLEKRKAHAVLTGQHRQTEEHYFSSLLVFYCTSAKIWMEMRLNALVFP